MSTQTTKKTCVVVVQAAAFTSFDYETCMLSIYTKDSFNYPDHNQYIGFEGSEKECEQWYDASQNPKTLTPNLTFVQNNEIKSKIR